MSDTTTSDDPLSERSDRLKAAIKDVDAVTARIKRLLEERQAPAEAQKEASGQKNVPA